MNIPRGRKRNRSRTRGHNGQTNARVHEGHISTRCAQQGFSLSSHRRTFYTTTDFFFACPSGVAVSDAARADDRLHVSFKCTSHHHGWYAAQVPHGTTYATCICCTYTVITDPARLAEYLRRTCKSEQKKKHCRPPARHRVLNSHPLVPKDIDQGLAKLQSEKC